MNSSRVNRREFLMRPCKYREDRDTVGGWYVSNFLPGVRAFWDGGISRGKRTSEIPYANVLSPKTRRLKERLPVIATGLWSKNGSPIIAPNWFLNLLPCMPLDGVLWAGWDNIDLCKTTCRKDYPDLNWKLIEFAVFSSPPIDQIFKSGKIINSTTYLDVNYEHILHWLHALDAGVTEDFYFFDTSDDHFDYEKEVAILRDLFPHDEHIYLLHQRKLPIHVTEAAEQLTKDLEKTKRLGGRGLILRHPETIWEPLRLKSYLKVLV